jgi:hypothetical protein
MVDGRVGQCLGMISSKPEGCGVRADRDAAFPIRGVDESVAAFDGVGCHGE